MGEIFKVIFSSVAAPVLLIFGFLLFFYVLTLVNVDPGPVFSVVISLTPIWLPLALFSVAFERWMYYVSNKYAYENGRTTLRIMLPQEVFKSPEAMESVLTQIHTTQSPDNVIQTYLDGKSPLTNSLELVSIGGEVRFYVNVPTKKVKNALEAALYSHYPGIEVIEEDFDYVDEIRWDPEKYEYMSFHMNKKEKGKDFLPIKTYIDMGMDRLPKEEQKFEPMAPMLEALSKMTSYERLWIQILAVPHIKKDFKNGSPFRKIPTWDKAGREYINTLLKRDSRPSIDEDTYERAPMLTTGERDTITAIERNISKYAFEVGIRWMYITPKGKFNGDFISGFLRSFSQYDVVGRNGVGVSWRTDFNYKFFSDPKGKKIKKWKEAELADYKSRYYYYRDRKDSADEARVMSTEELATIFHMPGSSVVTPGLQRITSTRKEAPSNLPTGLPTAF